ncbi:TIGR03757 family integrating conjugative element protein [Aromatoleum aromaticum]|uniref:TIGR03757 family integrating conjugative element protein n=1 Tax=Aromatoleum aromaticum TaxID=551760 RepID=UPI0014598C8D|nr:TIGR03757 family integrating conjugative element protein [Aromatoleum aromaticum]NMG56443.1 TIGR03757 family integrating conjugative element protein [Aromatoleum aromaticum]
MAAFFLKSSSDWPALGIAAALLTALSAFSTTAFAADVLVVTDSRHPVQSMAGARIIELDRPALIEAELSAGLPTEPGLATALVRQRLSGGQGDLQRQMGLAYQGVADAWGLGIAKIPAVVADRRYVVYGEPDVARAVARIDAYRSGQP